MRKIGSHVSLDHCGPLFRFALPPSKTEKHSVVGTHKLLLVLGAAQGGPPDRFTPMERRKRLGKEKTMRDLLAPSTVRPWRATLLAVREHDAFPRRGFVLQRS